MEKKRQGENNSCESKTRIWEPTGKGNVEIDLTVAGYHEWFDRILEDNAKARDRKPFIMWGMPNSDKAEQADAIRINGKLVHMPITTISRFLQI